MGYCISMEDVHVQLSGHPILRGVNLEAQSGEFVSIVGENGAGKTTLIKVVGGIIKPFKGQISLFGNDLSQYKHLNALRKAIGVVPQRSISHRFPIRVEEAVLMGRYGKIGLMRRPKKTDWDKAYEALKVTGIAPFAKKLIHELSGGEQQKVALARALAQEPSLLLLDEPTTYLDRESRSEIMETIHSIHLERRLTTLLVSHDSQWVNQFSDKVYLLKDGRTSLMEGRA
jgi:ABC-type cobalamin/Fe3+-siderophores transport system ATPase subunit